MSKRPIESTSNDGAKRRALEGTPALSLIVGDWPLLRTGLPAETGRRYLVVGEGDFSLSNALVCGQEDASNLTATTIRTALDNRQRFPQAANRITGLVSRGATVLHRVSAGALRQTDGIRDNYDLIVFTFPFADGSSPNPLPPSSPAHAALVAAFLRSASSVLRNEGEIAVTLHISPGGTEQFNTWNVADAAAQAQLQLIGRHEFTSNLFPGYVAYNGQGSAFKFHRACTYVFRREMSSTYTTFQSELQAWHAEATSFGNDSLIFAVEQQLRELDQIVQTRQDREAALEFSRRDLGLTMTFSPSASTPECALSPGAGAKPLCVACYDETDLTTRLECGHGSFCEICLQRLVSVALNNMDGSLLACPVASCRRQIEPSFISLMLDLSSADVLRLHEVCQPISIAAPTPGPASSFIRACDAEDSADQNIIMLYETARAEKWARCSCGFVIARSEGCSHMQCRCGRRFCYHCNRDLNEGSHYTCTAHANDELLQPAAAPPPPAPRPVPPRPRPPSPPRGRYFGNGGGCPVCGKSKRSKGGPFRNLQQHINHMH